MFDIPYTKATALLVAYCLFFYCFVCILYYNKALSRGFPSSRNYKSSVRLLSLLFLISVITFCLSGDYFTYQEIVKTYNPRISSYGEPIYHSIIGFVGKNYLLFRLVVWGGAEFLALLTFKRLNTNKFLSLFILYVLFIKTFFYARASLAMALYFYGLSFIIRPFIVNGVKIVSKALGLSLVIFSFSFHSSIAICIIATCVIFIPLNKKTIISIIILFLLLFFSRNLLLNLLHTSLLKFGNDHIQNKMAGYVIKEIASFNLLGTIRVGIDYSRFYLPLLFILLCFWDKRNRIRLLNYRWAENLLKVTIAIVVISAATILLNLPNNVLYYRILFCSMIPITILLSFLYSTKMLSRKRLKICLYLGIFVHVYDYLYAIATNSF